MPDPTTPLSFKVQGMTCAEEVDILKREIGPLVGGADRLSFDILNSRMTLLPGAEDVTSAQVVSAVARTGMRANTWLPGSAEVEQAWWLRNGPIALTVASGALALAGLLVHATAAGSLRSALGSEGMGIASEVPPVARVLYLAAIVAGGFYVGPKAWLAARRLRPDMNFLMAVAVTGAVVIGEWFEGATVAFLFALSLALERWSIGRARRAVAALMDLAPPTARVKGADGTETEMRPADVPVGVLFIVKPGEKIPLDGRVVEGLSHVNQAPITGESVPVAKAPGESIFAGTINGDGALVAASTKVAGETTLAGIVRMVGDAHARRASAEQWVERFARIYTPAVLALAALVLVLPPLLLGAAWGDWVYRALVLLVIGCPCALVISTPVSIVAALAAAARNGVLIKGGLYVEAPAALKAIAVDKTGTLTEGRPRVHEVVAMSEHSERELLEIVTALEARSDHPLATAIVEHAAAAGIRVEPAEGLQIIQGKGATGRVRGRQYWLGSHRYLEERAQETPAVHDRLSALASTGRSVVVVGDDDHVCGFVALGDRVRPEAAAAIASLRALDIEHVIMLTGDNQGTADAIARATGVDEVRAELLPADKVAAIEALVERYGQVAMVGDGVNDAPAMARASLGIAMGAVGSDAAIETADIALMSDELAKVPWLIAHSRRTVKVIRQNIAASLAVKALFVVLTFWGTASLWAAIAADMGTSLLVIFNALRLLAQRTPHPSVTAARVGGAQA